jgi:SPP1 gp7 family putative phage head morphogenesis protein
MPTANEQILDFQVRHQVGLQRLTAATIQKLIPILNRADEQIVSDLLKRSATLEGSVTSQRLQHLLRSVREINHDAHVELGRELRQELRDLARYEVEFQRRLIGRSVPVEFDMVTPSAEMLNSVVHSRPFQGRLLREWLSELDQGRQRRVRDAVRLGMVEGQTTEQIVRRIRGTRALNFRDGVMEISRRGAEAMVRTATAHTASAAREMLFRENGDMIKGVQWVATLDTRTCETCMGLDGRVFEIDRGQRPPAHIGCRCATSPVLKSWRELGIDIDDAPPGTRASMNGQVPQTQSYGEWLRNQPAEVQNEALGPTRGRLFRSGGLDVDRFTDTRGNQLTLDQLRAREAEAFERAGVAA